MKNFYAFSIIIILLTSFFIINRYNEKLDFNYTSNSDYIQIKVFNKSKKDLAFPFPTDFLINRKKYNDTLHLSSFKNGKRPKYISYIPGEKKKYIYCFNKITNLSKSTEAKILLTHKTLDSFLLGLYDLEKFPLFYIMKPNSTLLIDYKNKYPLEKGKYKIFLNKKAYVEFLKVIPIPVKFKLLESDEIDDNPLEFEVK